MENKKLIKKIVCLVLFFTMTYLFIYLGTKDYQNNIDDNIKFANEYKDISKNNVYSYSSDDEILRLINNKENGIIFMGFESNSWSHYYASILNDVALLRKVDKIYYYDFQKDRSIKSRAYKKLIEIFSEYLYKDDSGIKNLTAPTIIVIKKGKIIYFNNEMSYVKGNITPNEYFTDYRKNLLIHELDEEIKNYLGD